MNRRLSLDSTEPRRPLRRHARPGPRPEGPVEEEAELVRPAWRMLGRLGLR